MKRTSENGERMLKVLTADELRHVIGGTDDPSKPVGDPGGSRNADVMGQPWSGGR